MTICGCLSPSHFRGLLLVAVISVVLSLAAHAARAANRDGRAGFLIPAIASGELKRQRLFAFSRSKNFWILPVEVLGISSNDLPRDLEAGQVLTAPLDSRPLCGGTGLTPRAQGVSPSRPAATTAPDDRRVFMTRPPPRLRRCSLPR